MRPYVGHAECATWLATASASISHREIELIVVRNADEKAGDWEEWLRWTRGKFVVYFTTNASNQLPFPRWERPHRAGHLHAEYEVTKEASELGALARRSTFLVRSAKDFPFWVRSPSYADRELRAGTWLMRTDEGATAFHLEGSPATEPRALLVIPELLCGVVAHSEWIGAAQRHWRALDEDAFPNVATWEDESAWWTPLRRQLENELVLAREEFERARAKLQLAELSIQSAIHAESSRAETEERRLLMTQGEPLVEAARAAFNDLGFAVEIPSDEATSAKAEDLLVRRAGWDGWMASVEIKGFATSSAKVADVIKLGQRRIRRGASQAILVVNGQFSLPPPTRHRPFEGNLEAQEQLEVAGVLVVDSRDLHRALCEEQRAAHLVDVMKTMHGVYQFIP